LFLFLSLSFSHAPAQYFHDLFGVQGLLDTLRMFYWEVPDTGAMARDPFIHPVTKQVVAKRPPPEKLHVLQEMAISILVSSMAGPMKAEWVQSIMYTSSISFPLLLLLLFLFFFSSSLPLFTVLPQWIPGG
jgi:hypothetical protein